MLYLFWVIFFLIIFHYFFFPLIILVKPYIKKHPIEKKDFQISTSLIIAAYNEEKVIARKIRNSLDLDFPKEKLEIIVVSDGSSDRTHGIVKEFESKKIISLHEPKRRGKTAALNRAVKKSSGEIIVFSDANSMYRPDAVKKLIRNFYDPSIGGVCGRKSIVKNESRESSQGDHLFWDFESTLKTMQSRGGSISNGDGEIFAVRRTLYKEIAEEIINDDQAITFNIIKEGYRVVYESEAISFEEASLVLKDDFKVKARMVAGGYQTIKYYKNFLFPPFNYFSVQFISHKILRYIMPFLLVILFFCNAFILRGGYLYFLWLQLLFYSLALIGYLLKKLNTSPGIFYLPLYYCTMNIAAIYGFINFLSGQTVVSIWEKAQR